MKALTICVLAAVVLASCASAQQIRTVDLLAYDIIYDPVTQKIYASVPSTVPGRGNTITVIDPETGNMGASVFVGSEPVILALSDDGQYLYVGLDGAAAIRRFEVASQTAGLLFSLGGECYGPCRAEDIAVLPGHPESIAVSKYAKGWSPRHGGVAIYDNGVQRATTTPGHTGSNVIEFAASATRLYGLNTETTEFGFRRMNVDASGVSIVDVTQGLLTGFWNDIEFHNGLIYDMNGVVINPETLTLVGTYPVGYSLVAPDSSLGLTFFLMESGGTMKLQAYRLDTFVLVWSFDIPDVTVDDYFWRLIRWGTDGLAFCMSGDIGDKIFLIRTGLGPPAKPTNLTATALSSSQIRLTWSDNSNNEDYFDVERKTGAGNFTSIAMPAANSTSFTDSGARPNTTYVYRVRARTQASASPYSNEASAKTFIFSDVTSSDSFRPYAEALFRAGVTTGCFYEPNTGERRYCPLASVTRAEMAVFLCKSAAKTPLDPATPTFADVSKSHWAYGYVERLAEAASWSGKPPTGGCRVEGTTKYFCPGNPVTREQMAKFLCLAAGKTAMPSCSGKFVDVGTGSAFCPFIERLTDAPSWPGGVAVTGGCGCPSGFPAEAKCYCPSSNVTRAQMAVFLVRAFGIPL
jgi:hypothetical protein